MCIIVIKKANIKMPDIEILKNCWDNNSDGAGFMYANGKKVYIQKGFMKYKHFNKAIKNLKIDTTAVPMVFHFRITTHGGTSQGNTHPFPISADIKDLKKLKNSVDIGIAHNGIISGYGQKTISDTMDYIKRQLVPIQKLQKNFYNNDLILDVIKQGIQSKMVFLDYKGNIKTIGNFITDDKIIYSNDSYKKRQYAWLYSSPWDDYSFPKALNWLESGYIILKNGSIIEPWDYLIDKSGDVYKYDYIYDIAKFVDGATAYSDTGSFVKFKDDCIEYIEVS